MEISPLTLHFIGKSQKLLTNKYNKEKNQNQRCFHQFPNFSLAKLNQS